MAYPASAETLCLYLSAWPFAALSPARKSAVSQEQSIQLATKWTLCFLSTASTPFPGGGFFPMERLADVAVNILAFMLKHGWVPLSQFHLDRPYRNQLLPVSQTIHQNPLSSSSGANQCSELPRLLRLRGSSCP